MSSEQPTQSYRWTFRRVIGATLVLVLVALGFWFLYRSLQVIFILFIAIVIGTVIRPVVTWLFSHGMPRMVGSILVYLLLLGILIGFVLLLFPMITDQAGKIIASLPGYYQSLREWMVNNTNPIVKQLSQYLPLNLTLPMLVQQTGKDILSSSQALKIVTSAANFIFIATVVALLAFHWTLNGPRAIQALSMLAPTSQRERIRDLISLMEVKVSAYVAGEGILCTVIGTMSLISYLIIGLPNALVLAIVAGLLEAVPLIGPTLGAIPAGIIALSIAPSKLVWVIVSTTVIQQLENSLLVPRVMRKSVGVNPFVSLVALLAFSSLMGIPGAVMAVPIAAIIQILLDRFIFDTDTLDAEVPVGRGYASRLRYEAQELVQDLRKHTRLKQGESDFSGNQIDQVMDEIEAITTDLDAMLAQVPTSGEQ